MPYVTGNDCENSPSPCTLASMPSWHCLTKVMNLSGQQNLCMIFHNPSWLTVSKALVRSINVVKRLTFCSWHFSCNYLAASIMSIVPQPWWKLHWISGSMSCSRCWFRWFSRILANIFSAMESREMPPWLLQDHLFPFLMWRWTINASLNSCETFSCLHMVWSILLNFSMSSVPPAAYSSAVMESEPGDLPLDIILFFFLLLPG